MKKFKNFLLLVLILLFSGSIDAQNGPDKGSVYYVAQDGNDQWSGTISEPGEDGKDGPFLSIKKAMDVLQAGDTCFIREGLYRESIKPLQSGSSENKIVITSYGNEKVIVSACRLAEESWLSVEEKIFKTSWDTSQFSGMVFMEGKLVSQSRWPNASDDLFKPVYASVDSGDHQSMSDSDIPDHFSLEACEMEALFGKEWALQYYTLSSYDPETKTMGFPVPEQRSNYYAPVATWDDNYAARKDNRYCLVGHYDLLDADGEWYFDREEGLIYLFSEDGIDPSVRMVEIKTRDYCIDLSGRSHVEISGLEIFGGGILTDEQSTHCMIRGLKGIHVDPGVVVHGNTNELNSCEFAFSKGSIVLLDGKNNRIINNYLHDGSYGGSWDQILSVYGFRHLISHNTITRAGGGCILPSGKGIIYQHNDLSFAGLVRHDIGAMHCGNNSGENSVIAYNRVHDINGMGIYLDNSTSNYVIHHNLVYNCGWEYAMPNAPMEHLINNFVTFRLNTPGNFNLIYNNTSSGKMSFGSWGRNFIKDMYGDQLINNIFTGSIHLLDSLVLTHNIYKDKDPGFKDAEKLNFQLSPNSPAIDKALPLRNITGSFTGSGPDMGAFEYGVEPWSAGHNFDNIPDPEYTELEVEYRSLVVNGGFEVGLAGWNPMEKGVIQVAEENSWGLETAKTRMQTQSIAIEKNGAWIEQTLKGLEPETEYTFSGWIKAPGNGVSGSLTLSGVDGLITGESSGSGGWEFFKSSFKTSIQPEDVKIRMEKEGEGGVVYFDDIGLVRNMEEKALLAMNKYSYLTEEGAWCWFSDPRAIYVHGDNPGVLTGWVKEDGSIEVAHINREMLVQTQVLVDTLDVDDHANPSFTEFANGDYMVFYTKHFDDGIRVHYGDRESGRLFGDSVFIDPFSKKELKKYPLRRTTYANPMVLEGEENNLYCFGRWTGFKPNMMVSEDGGKTFSKSKVMITNYPFDPENRPYVKYYSDGGTKIHIVFTDGHPRNEALNSVYYAYYEDGAFWRIDGSKICTVKQLPFEPKDASLVYQATPEQGRSWVFDVASDQNGYPVILYARYPDDENHIYHHLSYDGQQWKDREICNSGKWFPKTPEGETEREPNYSGGMTLHPLKTNVLYASVQINGVFEIIKYTLAENGSWLQEPITEGSKLDNVRPFVPRNMREGDRTILLWMVNTEYIHYTKYESSIKYILDEQ